MKDNTFELMKRMLIGHEGLRLHPYVCPKGKITIGVGRNLDDLGISKEEAILLLENDIKRCESELRRSFHWFTFLSDTRKMVLINMNFTLGFTDFLEFEKMIAALEIGDFTKASKEILDSRWAREQATNRAYQLALIMMEG